MPRPAPVLPEQERSHHHVSRTDQIRMQCVPTLRVLTGKKQAFLWPVLLAGMSTPGTGLRGVVGIDLDGDRACQHCLVRNQGVQFGKGPLGVHPVRFAGLWGHPLVSFAVLLAPTFAALRALANVGEVF